MSLKRTTCLLGLLAAPVFLTAGLEVLLQPIRSAKPAKPMPPPTPVQGRVPSKTPVTVTVGTGVEDTALQAKFLTIDKLLPALVESVKETLHVDGDLRLTPRETWTPFYNRSKVFKIAMVEAIPAQLGPVSVIQFKVYADGKLLGVWKQAFHAQLFKDILVCEKPLPRGRFVDVADFEVRTMDVLQMRQRPVEAGEDLKRQQLRQSIRPGTPLLWRHVSAIPLVRKGDIVDVIASQGGLIINLKGQARENGADGDFILVRNPHSKRDFQAQVIDDKKVRVLF